MSQRQLRILVTAFAATACLALAIAGYARIAWGEPASDDSTSSCVVRG